MTDCFLFGAAGWGDSQFQKYGEIVRGTKKLGRWGVETSMGGYFFQGLPSAPGLLRMGWPVHHRKKKKKEKRCVVFTPLSIIQETWRNVMRPMCAPPSNPPNLNTETTEKGGKSKPWGEEGGAQRYIEQRQCCHSRN